MMKQYLSCQLALVFFSELHPEASTEVCSMLQNSHFHHASENGLTVLPKNPRISFPADGITLNFLVKRKGELGCFHCIEAHFDSGL
jgi:hypothetical protein